MKQINDMCDGYDVVENEFDRFSMDSLDFSKPSDTTDMRPIVSTRPFRLHGLQRESEKNDSRVLRKCEMDETELMNKGLQQNRDGSFSKSPREANLPFVMTLQKVAEFRRKKRSAARKSSEMIREPEILGSVGPGRYDVCTSSRSSTILKADGKLKAVGNLTDSMKEALFKTYFERRQRNFLPKISNSTENATNVKTGKQRSEEFVRTTKNPKKNMSDVRLPSMGAQKLSYYERYQKKNGFDPQSIRLDNLRTLCDTVRSNFGDSCRDSLPDVSGRWASISSNASEEIFYNKIIRKEEERKVLRESSRALSEKTEISNDKKKTTIKSVKVKRLESAMSCSKCRHLCLPSSASIPKAELISKAKAYGNMANTRNIAKLRLKSQTKEVDRVKIDSKDFVFPHYLSQLTKILDAGSTNKRGSEEIDKKSEVFLPALNTDLRKVRLPWETRNLLMQITTEHDHFKKNLNHLKNQFSQIQNDTNKEPFEFQTP